MTNYIANTLRPAAGIMTAALMFTQVAARADVVSDWNAIMQSTVSGLAPFPQARFAAMTQLAVFEAVNAIRKDYQPYLGTINAPADASAEAAAIAAAHAVLKNYFPASAAALCKLSLRQSSAWSIRLALKQSCLAWLAVIPIIFAISS